MTAAIFHLSLPAKDLTATEGFYCSLLGAARGRATAEWIDLIVFGHQFTFHHRPDQVAAPEAQDVQHFGPILSWGDVGGGQGATFGYQLKIPWMLL